jgi:glucose/mannose-6-phosphate isomerase
MIDKSNMIESIRRFPKQFEKSIEFAGDICVKEDISKVIIAGMGGSAFPGDILKTYLQDGNILVNVCRNYTLTTDVDDHTLVFISSFSGNTEETISSFYDAMIKGAKIVIVTAGGKLEELSKKYDIPMVKIVKEFSTFQPRAATGYFVGIFISVLANSGVIDNGKKDLINVGKFLSNLDIEQEAKQLAEKLVDYIPIIYTEEKYEKALARVIKIKFNENSKIQAFYNSFPELNHNEMVGFTNIKGKYYFIILKDPTGNERIKKRMEIFSNIMQDMGLPITIIEMQGRDILSKIFSGIYFFEFVSYYLALKYNIDPTPVEMVEDFKKALGSMEWGD